MRRLQRGQHLQHQQHCICWAEPPAGRPSLHQGGTVDKFHHHEWIAILDGKIMDRDDIRMRAAPCGLRLPAEPGDELWPVRAIQQVGAD